MTGDAIFVVVFLGALASFTFSAVAIVCAWRFSRRRVLLAPGFAPPVSILKPVRGLDPDALENFASFCRQDYPEYEILFCAGEASDPVILVIHRLMEQFPDRKIRLLIGADELGPHDKLNKLCRLVREARYDIFVVSDSDVVVAPDFLRSVVAPLSDSRIGAVTCLYRGIVDRQFWAEMEALGAATDFFAGVMVAERLHGVGFAFGQSIVISRARLAEIGGFESLVHHLAEDHEIGARLAARGNHVVISNYVTATHSPARSARDYFDHQRRWALAVRSARPWGYAGLLFTHALPWSLAAALLAPSWQLSLAILAVCAVLRLGVAWSVGIRVLSDSIVRRRWWLMPVRDVLGFVIWFTTFFYRRIQWRGIEYTVRRGILVRVAEETVSSENASHTIR